MAGARFAVALVWVLCIASFFVGGDAQPAQLGRILFFVLLAAHAGECLFFLGKLREAPGGLAQNLVQTMIFGIVHVRSLDERAGA